VQNRMQTGMMHLAIRHYRHDQPAPRYA
jgi:hypothetical protein